MQPPVYVDSGGWIGLFSRRDERHRTAENLFRKVVKQDVALLTSNLVVAEVHRHLLFRTGIQPARAVLDRICGLQRLSIEFVTQAHHEAAMDWLRRFGDQAFTYADATSFAVMEARGIRQVIGFDHHFQIAGFERWQPGR